MEEGLPFLDSCHACHDMPGDVTSKDEVVESNGSWSFKMGRTSMTYEGGYILRTGQRLKHGTGTMRWQDGREYQGEFSFDEIHGQGTMTWPTGATYVGQYCWGVKHGFGKFQWLDGWSLEGCWQQGQPDGDMVHIQEDGAFHVQYKSGEMLTAQRIPVFASFDGWRLKPEYDVCCIDSEETCCICLGTMHKGDTCCKMSCEHVFHKECIDSWVTRKNECPLCKQKIPLHKEYTDPNRIRTGPEPDPEPGTPYCP
jgi:hypothetical protein